MADGVDLGSRLDDLSARVRELEAVRALTELRHAFHHCLNRRDWAGLGALFTVDALLDYGELGEARGSAAIREYYTELLPKLVEMRGASKLELKNFNHVHQVEVDGDRATGVCYFEEHIRFDEEELAHQSVGRFSDRYVRQDGRWLFERVELEHYWVVPHNKGWHWPW
ncbi:SnoaL-like protein [Saccharothrix carnea]|uniref:SnoaL-like protein n=1 Tax=Saccharothrix carnea TaxID=1280637 RepID=A0A2P8IBG5_SACCR|nr:nuclear transport factor 2 family protein [Saccharothrix carnea]PSL55805.1 SnoaL-like protein [Saccharothrix carnea]